MDYLYALEKLKCHVWYDAVAQVGENERGNPIHAKVPPTWFVKSHFPNAETGTGKTLKEAVDSLLKQLRIPIK